MSDAVIAAEIDDHADVVARVMGERLPGPLVPRSVGLAPHHHQIRPGLEADIDIEPNVGQELDVVADHFATEILAKDGGAFTFGDALETEPDRAGRRSRHAWRGLWRECQAF